MERLMERLPLLYVLVAGVGFSVQGLAIKLISQTGVHISVTMILARGVIQSLMSAWVIYIDEDRRAGRGPKLFGDSRWVVTIMMLRSVLGYVGMMCAFRAVEFISIGDSTVLVMMCPVVSSLAGFVLLGESWRLPEFIATLMSIAGGSLVARPQFLFGGLDSEPHGDDYFWGVFYSISAAFTAGLAYVLVRVLGTSAKMPWANICFAQGVAQVVLSIPSMRLFDQPLNLAMGWGTLLAVVGVGVLGTCSQFLMTVGMQREKSASATAMLTSEVIVGYALQVAFTADPVTSQSLVGALLVSLGILIIVLGKPSDPIAASPASTSSPDHDKFDL